MATQPRSSFAPANRWTPAIISKGFCPVPLVLLQKLPELHLRPTEALLLVQIASFKWDSGRPFPSMKTLAKRMGQSERYVRRLCQQLEIKGLLRREERGGRSNEFELAGLFERLEDFIREEERRANPDAAA